LAAAQLDKNWDDWTTQLTESYAQSLELLDEGKTEEAVYTYRSRFLLTVKQLFSEAADVYPLRFENTICWTDWTKKLYQLSHKAEGALKAGEIDEARDLLLELRRHFYDLHNQCDLIKNNDALFAVMEMLNREDVTAKQITEAVDVLLAAEPCRKAKAENEAYGQTLNQWLAEVKPILEKDNLSENDRARFRDITQPFYKLYALQFE
jgi:hypothetical protein